MAAAAIPTIGTRRLVPRGPGDHPGFEATFASYRSRGTGGPLDACETWMPCAVRIGHGAIRSFGMGMIHARPLGLAGGWPEREIERHADPRPTPRGRAPTGAIHGRGRLGGTRGAYGGCTGGAPERRGNA